MLDATSREPGATALPEALPARWYAVRTRSHHEAVAGEHLRARGLEAFVPALELQGLRGGTVRRPVFPSYLFVRANLRGHERVGILSAPGVMHLVGFRAGPVAVPDETVHAVRRVLASRDPFEVLHRLVPGRRVRVIGGALAGVEGVIDTPPTGGPLLVVSIELLGRCLAVRLSRCEVEPVA